MAKIDILKHLDNIDGKLIKKYMRMVFKTDFYGKNSFFVLSEQKFRKTLNSL